MPGIIIVQAQAPSDPLVQAAPLASGVTSVTCTFAATPTPGNIMVYGCAARNNTGFILPSGWTEVVAQFTEGASSFQGRIAYRIVQSGDGTSYLFDCVGPNYPAGILAEFRAVSLAGVTRADNVAASTTPTISLTPTGGGPWVEIGYFMGGADGAGNSGPVSVGAGWTEVRNSGNSAGTAFGPYSIMEYRAVAAGVNPSINSVNQKWGGAALALQR